MDFRVSLQPSISVVAVGFRVSFQGLLFEESSGDKALLKREESLSGGKEWPGDEALLKEMEWENSFTGHIVTAAGCVREQRY